MGSSPPLKPLPDINLSLTLSSHSTFETLKPEERGIRLIHLLLTCATHVSSGNLHHADAFLQQISQLSSVTGDSMQRLAAQFASALAVRLVKGWPALYKVLNHSQPPKLEPDPSRFIFAQSFPYLRVAYNIINRTLIRTMADERFVHIVDLGSGDPNVWGPLFRYFSQVPRGSPHLKITCVHSDKEVLHNLGSKLVKEAEVLDVPFQFNPLNVDLKDLTIDMLNVRSGEALAITSVLNLHVLLAEEEEEEEGIGAHLGDKKINGDKECQPMNDFLKMVRSLSPKVVLLVEQESDHNSTRLIDRFVDGLYYYSAVFDSIEANSGSMSFRERLALEEMFGKEIENIVACEGIERNARHERYMRWMGRLGRAGFKPIRLWYDAMVNATQSIEYCTNDSYKVISERGSLMICWHERPLYSVSAWHC